MAVLIDAITVKRKSLFEFENIPFCCLEAEVSTPTARGGQTLVRLKIRNLLTSAVFEKTFKAGDKFKEPDLQYVAASYLYSDGEGSHFLGQSVETILIQEVRTLPVTVQIGCGNKLQIRLFELVSCFECFLKHSAGKKVANLQAH